MFCIFFFTTFTTIQMHFQSWFCNRQMEEEWESLQWLSATFLSQHTTSRTLTTQKSTGECDTIQVDCNVSLELLFSVQYIYCLSFLLHTVYGQYIKYMQMFTAQVFEFKMFWLIMNILFCELICYSAFGFWWGRQGYKQFR